MSIVERIDKIISESDMTTKKQLLEFWKQHYSTLTEDARIDEYERLKKAYFDAANTYEGIIKDPRKAEDEALYKKFMIMQRKIGIRMISVASGTGLEDEARTFEAQTSNTPAGDRSVTNIRYQAQRKVAAEQAEEARSYSSSEYFWRNAASARYGQKQSFIDFVKMFFMNKEVQKRLVGKALWYCFLELLTYLVKLQMMRAWSRSASVEYKWSEIISRVVGEDVVVKVINSPMYVIYSFGGSIAITSKIFNKLSEEEIIALSLYSYGTAKNAALGGIAAASLKTIIYTSIDFAATYVTISHGRKTGISGEEELYSLICKMIYTKAIAEFVMSLLFIVFRSKMEASRGIKFVVDKGYAKAFMSAKKKLPTKRAERFPDIDEKTAGVVANYFVKSLNVMGLKEDIDKDNTTKSMSLLKKFLSVFKRF